jgi:hypothetical protein
MGDTTTTVTTADVVFLSLTAVTATETIGTIIGIPGIMIIAATMRSAANARC